VVALSGEHSQSERNQALQALRDRRARVCVATDVAARGIDLPTLSLVVHVEIPRDAETLQHRSGRTGRAGRKGIAVLIVPYSRRKRIESMLRHAQINAEWQDVPDREAILEKDRERLLAKLLAPVEIDEADRALAERLLAERSPQEIAGMLVAAHRASMPEPEELIANTPQARAEEQKERHRPGFEDTVWFRMDIGRSQNADPRWILPLLCRRGHVTRGEIGAIRIGQAETYFQIPRTLAAKFADAVARTAQAEGEEEAVIIERSETGPREAARGNRQLRPSRSTADNAFVKAKPAGKTFARKPNGGGGAPGGPSAKPWHGKKPGPSRKPGHKHKQP
jgi:ATP-dependent RNA helicase DeaD